MILVNVLLGFSQSFRAIPIMNPLPWFMILLRFNCIEEKIFSVYWHLFIEYI